MAVLSDIYSDQLLEAAASLPPADRLANPDATASKTSKVCGSTVTVDVAFDGGEIREFAIDAKACALGQAAAAVVARHAVGLTAARAERLRGHLSALLAGDGHELDDPAAADFAPFAALMAYPQRHASVMLAIEAVCACFDNARKDGGSAYGSGAGPRRDERRRG